MQCDRASAYASPSLAAMFLGLINAVGQESRFPELDAWNCMSLEEPKQCLLGDIRETRKRKFVYEKVYSFHRHDDRLPKALET